jgi:hypothetical protein
MIRPKLERFKETEGNKDASMTNPQFMERIDTELKHAERKTCNETMDIRDKVVSGNPFTPSGNKVLEMDLRHSEKPKVMTDAQLHADTTEMGINVVEGMKKGAWAESSEIQLSRQKDKDKYISGTTKRKVFQN